MKMRHFWYYHAPVWDVVSEYSLLLPQMIFHLSINKIFWKHVLHVYLNVKIWFMMLSRLVNSTMIIVISLQETVLEYEYTSIWVNRWDIRGPLPWKYISLPTSLLFINVERFFFNKFDGGLTKSLDKRINDTINIFVWWIELQFFL